MRVTRPAAMSLGFLFLLACERECPQCPAAAAGPAAEPAARPYQAVKGDGFVAELPPDLKSAFTPEERTQREAQLVAFVKLGYGDSFDYPARSLEFRTEELSTREAQMVIGLVDSYNNFDGAKVARVIGRFDGRVESWEFGREGSPVLYIRLPHHRAGTPPGQLAPVDPKAHAALVADLRKAMVDELEADEFDAAYAGTAASDDHFLRVWWD